VKKVRKFLRLPASDRSLLIRTLCLVARTRLRLWLFPFRAQQAVAGRAMGTHIVSRQKLAWAVTTASNFVPGATCLTQALALQTLLARSGHGGRVQIGVAREGTGEFVAHAWVECHGEILIGGHNVERYAPLAVFED